MNQKIITIAGIVFALIFIVLLAVMMSTVTEKTNTANAQMVDTLAMTEGTDLNTMDGSTVRGNMVTSTIKNGKSDSGKDKMFYVVTTGGAGGTTTTYYGYGEDGSSMEVFDKNGENLDYTEAISGYTPSSTYVSYNVTDTSRADYINEKSAYNAHVLYSKNGVAVGVHFLQEGIQ